MVAVTELIKDVLKLPRTERSYIARKLLESLETDGSFSAEEMQMLERRSRDIRSGTVAPLTLEELQRELVSRLA